MGLFLFLVSAGETTEEDKKMGLLELFLIAVGLSMDAFAVSVCKGLSVRTLKAKHAVICGLYFGGFQLLMPLIGFALGVRFQSLITSIDHWIAFILLAFIGGKMMVEAIKEWNDEEVFSYQQKQLIKLLKHYLLTVKMNYS